MGESASTAAEAAWCGFLAFFIFMCLAGAEAPSAAIGAEAWAKETAAKEESRAATMKVLVISDSSSDEIRFGSDSLESGSGGRRTWTHNGARPRAVDTRFTKYAARYGPRIIVADAS